jgi:preprotein translocase subunit SecE
MKNRTAVSKRTTPRFNFIGETISELKKVVWLSRQEVIYLTTLVLVVVIAVGALLGAIDFGFSKLASILFVP